MKLATYRDGSRNGQLVVVSRDLSLAHYATGAAHTLQQALDDWSFIAPQLQDLSLALNRGRAPHPFAFDPAMCLAPLPRASQCLRGAACASHRDTVLAAGLLPCATTTVKANAHSATAGASRPGRVGGRAQPDLLGLAGDAMQGALQPMPLADEAQGLDFEAGLAVITADIPAASPPARALEGVRLLMLANTWCLRSLQAQELAAGVGAVQSRPAQAFGPVAVTPDELGDAWTHGKVHLSLHTHWNGRRVGLCDVGDDMTLHLGQLLAQAAATRALRAGTVLTTGPVSSPPSGGAAGSPGPDSQWPKGFHSILEKRAMEALQTGQAQTAYLRWGDTVRIDLKGRDGSSPLGVLEQRVLEPDQD